jgi:plasmid stability protein
MMTVMITIPHEIERKLQRKAEKERRSMEQVILDLLTNALENDSASPSPEEVVARIQAAPPAPGSFRPASGSLADALRNAPDDPAFDLATWNQSWLNIEAEMRAMTRANSVAEGRA